MEIYNENAYDLLDKKHIELSMENWNKVKIYLFFLLTNNNNNNKIIYLFRILQSLFIYIEDSYV